MGVDGVPVSKRAPAQQGNGGMEKGSVACPITIGGFRRMDVVVVVVMVIVVAISITLTLPTLPPTLPTARPATHHYTHNAHAQAILLYSAILRSALFISFRLIPIYLFTFAPISADAIVTSSSDSGNSSLDSGRYQELLRTAAYPAWRIYSAYYACMKCMRIAIYAGREAAGSSAIWMGGWTGEEQEGCGKLRTQKFPFWGFFCYPSFSFFSTLRFILIFCGVYLFPVFFSLPCSFSPFLTFSTMVSMGRLPVGDVERIQSSKTKETLAKTRKQGRAERAAERIFSKFQKPERSLAARQQISTFLSSATTPPLFILLYIEF